MEEDIKTGPTTEPGVGPDQSAMAAEDYFRAGMLFFKKGKIQGGPVRVQARPGPPCP